MKIRGKLGTACIILGTVLIIGALSLFAYNLWEDYQAGKYSDGILSELEDLDGGDGAYDPYKTDMTEVVLDGEVYIGWISIPALSLDLPVAGEWSYPQLKNTPCRFAGSAYTDDLVICAHNYSRHFGNIKTLSAGDTVYFIDLDGMVWEYEVAAVETLEPTAVEEMTSGGFDLTLFTCTYGGQSRVTVRCSRVE